jgi:hypothetical protein
MITLSRRPWIDDGYGEQTLDVDGTPTSHRVKCRIFHERSQIPDDNETPAGISTNLQRAIMTDYKNIIKEHDTFTWIGSEWEIGPVDTVVQFGGTVGYQAPLREGG